MTKTDAVANVKLTRVQRQMLTRASYGSFVSLSDEGCGIADGTQLRVFQKLQLHGLVSISPPRGAWRYGWATITPAGRALLAARSAPPVEG